MRKLPSNARSLLNQTQTHIQNISFFRLLLFFFWKFSEAWSALYIGSIWNVYFTQNLKLFDLNSLSSSIDFLAQTHPSCTSSVNCVHLFLFSFL